MSTVSFGVRGTSSNLGKKLLLDEDSTPAPYQWVGTRGNSWDSCYDWFDTMPGSLFQLTCLFFFLAFMGGGKSAVAAAYTHVLCACSFLAFAIFGIIDACSPDMVVWGVILMVVNILQVLNTSNVFLKKTKNFSTEEILILFSRRKLHENFRVWKKAFKS